MATRLFKKPTLDTGVGNAPVGGIAVIVFAVVFIILSLVLLYATIAYWPPTVVAGAAVTDSTISFLGQTLVISRDMHILLIVAILGGLGAMAHVMRSFFKYAGERQLIWSWMISYFLIPFVGAVLALITYIVLRAGLVSGVGSQEGNIWGFAAVAVLVGLFSAQAASKLKDIFETILTPAPQGSEALDPEAPTTMPIRFAPKTGAVGARVEITGEGIEAATSVVFAGGATATPLWETNKLVMTVPAGAQTGPLKVMVGTTEFSSTEYFKVTT